MQRMGTIGAIAVATIAAGIAWIRKRAEARNGVSSIAHGARSHREGALHGVRVDRALTAMWKIAFGSRGRAGGTQLNEPWIVEQSDWIQVFDVGGRFPSKGTMTIHHRNQERSSGQMFRHNHSVLVDFALQWVPTTPRHGSNASNSSDKGNRFVREGYHILGTRGQGHWSQWSSENGSIATGPGLRLGGMVVLRVLR